MRNPTVREGAGEFAIAIVHLSGQTFPISNWQSKIGNAPHPPERVSVLCGVPEDRKKVASRPGNNEEMPGKVAVAKRICTKEDHAARICEAAGEQPNYCRSEERRVGKECRSR